MNLTRPKALLVSHGDPRHSRVALQYEKRTKKRSRRALAFGGLFTGAVIASMVFLVPGAFSTLWQLGTEQSAQNTAALENPIIGFSSSILLPQALPANVPAQPEATQPTTASSPIASPIKGARLIIPKMKVDMPLVQGTNENALLKGAWLSPWGSTPDQGGNTTIFGHRFLHLYPNPVTFHALDRLVAGDTFTVQWKGQTYTYQVVESKIVPPTEVSVMNPTAKPTITLITCTPVFTTKNRLVVRAERI